MTIEINEQTLGIWYVDVPNQMNWMASAWLADDGTPLGGYRFRYYKDDRAFDSADEKSWYDLKPSGTQPVDARILVESISEMARFIEAQHKGSQRWELIRGTSSYDQFLKELMQLPFVNSKMPSNPSNWMCLGCGNENTRERVSCHKCHQLRPKSGTTRMPGTGRHQ